MMRVEGRNPNRCAKRAIWWGLSVIFGVARIVNFAHGSVYMLGIYTAYALVVIRDWIVAERFFEDTLQTRRVPSAGCHRACQTALQMSLG